jgi:hypothetical protein
MIIKKYIILLLMPIYLFSTQYNFWSASEKKNLLFSFKASPLRDNFGRHREAKVTKVAIEICNAQKSKSPAPGEERLQQVEDVLGKNNCFSPRYRDIRLEEVVFLDCSTVEGRGWSVFEEVNLALISKE